MQVGTRADINPGNGNNDAGDKASGEENVASPVIHQDVWCPDVRRRNSKVLNHSVLRLIPTKIVVRPFLQGMVNKVMV